jgi:hypothetical protein
VRIAFNVVAVVATAGVGKEAQSVETGSALTKGAAGSAGATEKVADAANTIEKFVGTDARVALNEAKDLSVRSADEMRQVDFHFNKTKPHSNPHCHITEW